MNLRILFRNEFNNGCISLMFNVKKLIPFIILGGLSACSENDSEILNESRDSSMQLAGQLKAKLKASLQSDGPVEAIAVCNVEAEIIALQVAKDNNLLVGRTSLKVRNPSNAADAWERDRLLGFEQQMKLGKSIKTLEVSEITEDGNEKWFRYMKAIPTQDVCIACHGESVASPVQERLSSLYPDDQATGYKISDVRGAFTVKIKL